MLGNGQGGTVLALQPGCGLTRAPLGYSAERALLRGIFCSIPNFRTNGRREAGEEAIESPEREDANAYVKKISLSDHVLGQGQVKGQ